MTTIDKKKIGCDVDDVLISLVPTWLDIFNFYTQCNIQLEDIRSWNIESYIPEEHRKYFWSILSTEELWETIQPLPDSQMYLKKLNAEYDLYLITATHWTNATMKGNMLNRLYPFVDIYKKLIIAPNKQMIGVDLLVDDNIANLVGGTYNKLLYTQPWNKDFNCIERGILRINDWSEAYKGIKTLLPTE